MVMTDDRPKKEEVFRQVALDRLSSPEQLDQMMRPVGANSWIALSGLGVLLLAVAVWGVMGSIPTKVHAQGVLIRPGGIYEVYAQGAGQLAEILVKEGDTVQVGQVVARIDHPQIEREIASGRLRLAELRRKHEQLSTFTSRDVTLRANSLLMQEAKLKSTVAFAEQRLASLKEQLASEEGLLEKGLIIRQTVLQTRQAYFATQDLLEGARNELKQLPISDLTTRSQGEQNVLQSQLQISETERQIELLEQQLQQLAAVASPYHGRVVEVKRDQGDFIASGAPLVSLELAGQESVGLQVVAFVPPTDGKDVHRDMEVQVSPSTARREEFGFLTGRVSYVSEFPSTPDGMMRVLGNATLVQAMAGGGAPFAAYIDLERDPATVSGYRWSSFKGNPLPVNSGTLCTVSITVRERRPIELVIPTVRQALGL